MTKGSCHCQSVSWSIEGAIERITACNCSICRRYGSLWAYGYAEENITTSGEPRSYSHGDKMLGFNFCPSCGCIAYWKGISPNKDGKTRVAVNMRLVDEPDSIQDIPIRHFDGWKEFKEASKPESCVRDLWF